MFRRVLLAGIAALAAMTFAQTTTTVAPPFGATPTAAPAANPLVPFPNPSSPCQVCANANGAPAQCATAYKGVPGQFCYKFLSAGTTQACCCPTTAKCAPQTAQVNVCQCDSGPNPAPVVVVRKSISPWVWVAVALGVVLLVFAIYWCCCRTVDVIEEPVYVQPGYGQPGYVQQGYVQGGPVVVGGPGYGYGGGDVAAGVAIGAAAGVVGGVALGAAIADAGHGGYHGGGYGGGYTAGADPSAGGGFSGGGDFAGDF